MSYWITSPLLCNYGSIKAFPWDVQWAIWAAKWPDIGIFYIVSNAGWTCLVPGVLKFGVSNSIGPGRMASYNGTNITDCTIEFMVICANVTELEDCMKAKWAHVRAVESNERSEWVIVERTDLVNSLANKLSLDADIMKNMGVPIYNFDAAATAEENADMAHHLCEPYRELTYLNKKPSIYTLHEKILVAIFQQRLPQWDIVLGADDFHLIKMTPGLIVPVELLQHYLDPLNRREKWPVDLTFQMAPPPNSVEWNIDDMAVQKDDDADAPTDIVNPWVQFYLSLQERLHQQLLEINGPPADDPAIPKDTRSWKILRQKDAPKKIGWTPKEEWLLQKAVQQAPSPISWEALFDKHRSQFHQMRRPHDLCNKWTYMQKSTPERVWPELRLQPSLKRPNLFEEEFGPVPEPKRVRRKIQDMPQRQVWSCSNCTKKYAIHRPPFHLRTPCSMFGLGVRTRRLDKPFIFFEFLNN